MNKNLPKLTTPPLDEVWAMVSNHPCYPSVEFFVCEKDARDAAAKEIADMHAEDGHHEESSVLVVQVMAKAAIKTLY